MQGRDELTAIQPPFILKHVVVRSNDSTTVSHVYITNEYKQKIVTKEEVRALIVHHCVPVFDAQKNIIMMPGLFDSHVHGQGGSDFSAVTTVDDLKIAAIALGQSGLNYAMATLPSMDPDWCEFRLMDELPEYLKGATTERNNLEQALFKQLPGISRTSFLIVNETLYYVDKIEEQITEIKNIDHGIIKQLKTEMLLTDEHSFIEVLSKEQLQKIERLIRYKRPVRGLPFVLKIIEDYIQEQNQHITPGAAKILGVHLEGPFIAHNCKGAHDERVLQERIDYNHFMTIIDSVPKIKNWKITLAPDLPGALEFMRTLKNKEQELADSGLSIKINIGHCNASEELISQFMNLGSAGITHCGNACKEPNCRKANVTKEDLSSNLVQWVIKNPDLCPAGIELIVDGHHLSKQFVKLVHETIGNKINLVTDALGPTGLDDGRYMLGTLPIYKKGAVFYLADPSGSAETYTTHPPTLAGGATPLHNCAQRFSDWVCTDTADIIETLYKACVQNPRESSLSAATISELELDDRNCVFFKTDGKLVMNLCNGTIFVCREELRWVRTLQQRHIEASRTKSPLITQGFLSPPDNGTQDYELPIDSQSFLY